MIPKIEVFIYSYGEYIDIFSLHPRLGEQIRQALIDVVQTKRLDALKHLIEDKKIESNKKYMANNLWNRYYTEKKQNITSLQDYIEPANTKVFDKELQNLLQQGVIETILPEKYQVFAIRLSNHYGALSKVLSLIVSHTRNKYLKMNKRYPSQNRREFTHRLQEIFGISKPEQRSFNRTLCRIIKETKK